MLKIVCAYDMNPNYVLEFYHSYENKSEMQIFAIEDLEESVDDYFKTIENYNTNIYYLIDDANPSYIIGYGTIYDTKDLEFHVDWLNYGNISYSIRPYERNRGYATELLRLLLLKCSELGIVEVCIVCLEDNVASKTVIENNNGVLEKEFNCAYLGGRGLKYRIQISKEQKEKII